MDSNVTGRVGALDFAAFDEPRIGCIVQTFRCSGPNKRDDASRGEDGGGGPAIWSEVLR